MSSDLPSRAGRCASGFEQLRGFEGDPNASAKTLSRSATTATFPMWLTVFTHVRRAPRAPPGRPPRRGRGCRPADPRGAAQRDLGTGLAQRLRERDAERRRQASDDRHFAVAPEPVERCHVRPSVRSPLWHSTGRAGCGGDMSFRDDAPLAALEADVEYGGGHPALRQQHELACRAARSHVLVRAASLGQRVCPAHDGLELSGEHRLEHVLKSPRRAAAVPSRCIR